MRGGEQGKKNPFSYYKFRKIRNKNGDCLRIINTANQTVHQESKQIIEYHDIHVYVTYYKW